MKELEEFDDRNLKWELELRGYYVTEYNPEQDISYFSDNEIKEEYHCRNLKKSEGLWHDLYDAWHVRKSLTDTDKYLKLLFEEYTDWRP